MAKLTFSSRLHAEPIDQAENVADVAPTWTSSANSCPAHATYTVLTFTNSLMPTSDSSRP